MLKKTLGTLFLILLFLLSFAQDKDVLFSPLNYSFKGISIDSAINLIEKDIEFYFIYDAELVTNKPNIKANFTNCPLTIILDSLFKNPVLNYSVIQKQIVIFKEKTSKNIIKDAISLKHKTVTGLIMDSLTKEPLPYSSISILNKGTGTISNLEGKFSFIISEIYFSDTLVISHLGFKPIFVKISELDENILFKLQEKTISLQEILIRWTDPRELLIKALRSVKENYPDNPLQLRAFYRESLQRNDKYMLYIEGLLDIYKGAYRPTLYQDQAKLLQLRKFTNVETSDTILIKLQGGIDASLTLDLLRNPLNFIRLSTLENYDYFYSGMESISDINAHTIKFKPNSNNEENLYEGTIHIDPVSLAIIRIRFKLITQNGRKLAKDFVTNSSPGIKVIPKNIEYTISYKKINNKYTISHIIGELLLKVKRMNKLLSSNYNMRFEMITTDAKTTDIQRFTSNEKVKSHQILTDIDVSYLKNINQYWGIDNFILPESDLIKALNKFKIEELTYCPNKENSEIIPQ